MGTNRFFLLLFYFIFKRNWELISWRLWEAERSPDEFPEGFFCAGFRVMQWVRGELLDFFLFFSLHSMAKHFFKIAIPIKGKVKLDGEYIL